MPIVQFDAKSASPSAVKRATRETLISGGKLKEWWRQQANKTVNDIVKQVRIGLNQGETHDQIARRIAGGTVDGVKIPGVMATSRRNAAALTATAMNSAQTAARLEGFRANKDVIKGYQQVSTLDNRTSDVCIAYSGEAWTLEGKPIPPSSLPFLGGPPRHFNCRSTLVPVLKSFDELGIDLAEIPEGTRASMDGQVPGNITFHDWLTKKGTEFQNKLLGPKKAALWRSNAITLKDLVNQSGNPLTIDELEELVKLKQSKPKLKPKPKPKPTESKIHPKVALMFPVVKVEGNITLASTNLPKYKAIEGGLLSHSVQEIFDFDKAQLAEVQDLLTEALAKPDMILNKEIKTLEFGKLFTLQSTVNVDKVSDMVRKVEGINEKNVPVVWKLPDGTLVLKDGNHRVSAMIAKGEVKGKFLVMEVVKLGTKPAPAAPLPPIPAAATSKTTNVARRAVELPTGATGRGGVFPSESRAKAVKKLRARRSTPDSTVRDILDRTGLDDDDFDAIHSYTGSLHRSLNRYLRDTDTLGRRHDKAVPAFIDQLNIALEKLDVFEGLVYRGMELPPEATRQWVKQLTTPGAVFFDPGFLSATSNARAKFPGNIHLTIISKSGRPVQEFSKFAQEAEVLFRSNTKFRVLSVSSDDEINRYDVALEEILE